MTAAPAANALPLIYAVSAGENMLPPVQFNAGSADVHVTVPLAWDRLTGR